jgi:hypothetical protein
MPLREHNRSSKKLTYPAHHFNFRSDLSAQIKGLCTISFLVRYTHQRRRAPPRFNTAPSPPNLPQASSSRL